MNIRNLLEAHITATLVQVSGLESCAALVNIASRPEFGDYQANGVMAVAKIKKINPRMLAEQVINQLPELDIIDKLEVAGPGFINIHLANTFLGRHLNSIQAGTELLIPLTSAPQRIVVDYSSPNLAKEMHVGHLRGTIIGDCLVRVLEKLGHHVIRQNHVGDWGTQFGMLIAYLQLISKADDDLPTKLADLEGFYRAAKAKFDSDLDFAESARASVVKLQSGDSDATAIWKIFIAESLAHCEKIYRRLNIRITRDDLCAESFYNDRLNGIVNSLEEKALLSNSDGARCVFLPDFFGKDGSPLPVIIQKSDGGFLYATTDLAAVEYRCHELHADRVLYVVDARQSLHFQQIFAVAKAAGYSRAGCKLEHVAYGTMMGKDGRPFKTRNGDNIKLEELLNEATRRAFNLVNSKSPYLSDAEKQRIADVVGIAAVKYADLSKNRSSDYVFDWDSMLSFEGNTAPYLLYAYTRIQSILRKQEKGTADSSAPIQIMESVERALAIKLLQFTEQLHMIENDYLPSQLCTYLYELAGIFMRFYEACPILKAEPAIRDSRLMLARLTGNYLREGLGLLGLETLEQM